MCTSSGRMHERKRYRHDNFFANTYIFVVVWFIAINCIHNLHTSLQHCACAHTRAQMIVSYSRKKGKDQCIIFFIKSNNKQENAWLELWAQWLCKNEVELFSPFWGIILIIHLAWTGLSVFATLICKKAMENFRRMNRMKFFSKFISNGLISESYWKTCKMR